VDLVLIHASPYELPPSHRAAAIVYDGTADLGLWRPPGPDRELLEAYGNSLPAVLAKERAQLRGGRLEIGQAMRLHPGKLRCDYLIWVASRAPHGQTEPGPAPGLEAIEPLVASALALAGKHGTLRIAFGAVGGGAAAADAAERMAAVVRAADAYRAACVKQSGALSIEEVLVCGSSAAEVAKARRLTARLAKQATAPVSERTLPPPAPRAPRAAGKGAGSARRGKARRLDPAELATARVRAAPYDRGRSYSTGEWFIHPSFGTGQVQAVLGPERMLTALFEDGEERRLIHARA
jgi:O-acetyl-ADP-ribose deacetylase (regulator of RNase III)